MLESQPQCRPLPKIPLKVLIGRHNAENQPGQKHAGMLRSHVRSFLNH